MIIKVPENIITAKMDPEKLRELNDKIAKAEANTEPAGNGLLWIMFKVGGVMRLVVEVTSCGPGARAVVETQLFRKVSSDEFTLINNKMPDCLPLDRDYFSIDYDGIMYFAKIAPES